MILKFSPDAIYLYFRNIDHIQAAFRTHMCGRVRYKAAINGGGLQYALARLDFGEIQFLRACIPPIPFYVH